MPFVPKVREVNHTVYRAMRALYPVIALSMEKTSAIIPPVVAPMSSPISELVRSKAKACALSSLLAISVTKARGVAPIVVLPIDNGTDTARM